VPKTQSLKDKLQEKKTMRM